MAIRRMVSGPGPGVEVVTDYSGHEDGRVLHSRSCPLAGKFDLSGARSADCPTTWDVPGGPCSVFGPLFMETTHKGLVLSTGERNGYDDSDFYATVWNEELGKTETIEYATTRGWTYPNSAWIDASPEVRAKFDAWRDKAREAARLAAVAREARTVRKGRTVKVVRGRKVPRGLTGTVIWAGEGKFGGLRVGFRDDADSTKVHWTAASNVEVLVPETWMEG